MVFSRKGSHNITDPNSITRSPCVHHPRSTMSQGVVNLAMDEVDLNGNLNNHPLSQHNNLSSPASFMNNNLSTVVQTSGGPLIVDGGMNKKFSVPSAGMIDEKKSLRLTWDQISLNMSLNGWSRRPGNLLPERRCTKKEILSVQSGFVNSGELIGIMGVSGAGKSSLLNCLVGRYRERHGLRGDIHVTRTGSIISGSSPKSGSGVDIAFIPQRDNLFHNFTVKETLIFASRMKNVVSSGVNHEQEAERVMQYLNLQVCAKTNIGCCSGGQVKRVCIGVELVTKPDILMLDEPTTGLDSSTAFQCINLLKSLSMAREGVSNPPAILATIHQPSSKLLQRFSKIYLLSKNGRCLFFGPPEHIKPFFVQAGLEYPLDYNPADFAIEIAHGDYGDEIFNPLEHRTNSETMAQLQAFDASLTSSHGTRTKMSTIVKKMDTKQMSFIHHTYLLLVRNWQKIFRDSGQLYLRIVQNIIIGLMVSYLWNPDIGSEDGCWSDFLDQSTKSANASDAKNVYLTKISRINANSALLFSFLIYVIMVSVMSTVLSFPSETLVIVKEMKNNWYSCSSYYWSKFIAEIPILCIMILILLSIIYPLTGQIAVMWRFLLVYGVTCMMAEVCQSIGMLFGTIFSDDLISACFSSVASGFPPILFGGFVVQIHQIRWYLKPFAYLSYLKYAFESVVIAIYGYERCTKKISNNFVDRISKSKNPVELIGTLVSTFNLTSKDAATFSALLNVETSCVEGLINGTIDYFGLSKDNSPDYEDGGDDGDYDAETSTTTMKAITLPPIDSGENEEASYVLSYFGLKEDVLFTNILALVVFIITLKVLTYSVLKHKARK